jgi:hypothetical protein
MNMHKYGMQTMLDETVKDIRESKLSHDKFHLQGVHTYDILRNPLYQQAF